MKRKHFLHIGRTGGTAIYTALQKTDLDFEWHEHAFTLADLERGKDVIFFYRDPVTRFTSAFYSRKREGKPRYNSPHTEVEKKAFNRFETPNELAEALPSKEARTAMNNISHINQPLSYYLKSIDYLKKRKDDIYFYGRQETLNKDFTLLKEKLGIETELPTDKVKKHATPDKYDRTLSQEAKRKIKSWYRQDYKIIELIPLL